MNEPLGQRLVGGRVDRGPGPSVGEGGEDGEDLAALPHARLAAQLDQEAQQGGKEPRRLALAGGGQKVGPGHLDKDSREEERRG